MRIAPILARFTRAAALALLLSAAGCATTRPLVGPGAAPPRATAIHQQTGFASCYGRELDGRRTASGERFDRHELTAAHPTLPFGTRVRVTHLGNGRQVTVRINDRGPFARGRILDLSEAAARRLGFAGAGVAKVKLEVL